MTVKQAQVRELYSELKNQSMVARALGISRQAVHQALNSRKKDGPWKGLRCPCGAYSVGYAAAMGHACEGELGLQDLKMLKRNGPWSKRNKPWTCLRCACGEYSSSHAARIGHTCPVGSQYQK